VFILGSPKNVMLNPTLSLGYPSQRFSSQRQLQYCTRRTQDKASYVLLLATSNTLLSCFMNENLASVGLHLAYLFMIML
jgi:hypothetical protein